MARLPSLAAIDAELARRKRKPLSPAALAHVASRGTWLSAPHLDLLDRKLCDLAARRIKRLIVTMPPRHGKSQLCSRFFPAWYLGTFPEHRLILCSYEANFASEWGGRARDVLSEYGQQLFGVTVRDDSSARDDWKIDAHDGGMVTAGVGGPITGRGADVLVIDDPVKNAEQANSATFQERVWQWWTSTALTRVEPDGVVLIIMTRWHEGDLVGRLLQQNKDGDADDNEKWEVLNLPAIAEENDALGRKVGDPLWDWRWPLSKLMPRMRRLGLYVWNALFQQRPSALEGNIFKRAWFTNFVDIAPVGMRAVRYWDLAATKKGKAVDPDWAVGLRMSTNGTQFWIEHVERLRDTPQKTEEALKRVASMDGSDVMIRVEQEPGAASKLYIESIARTLNRYDLCGMRSTGDKVTRARPFAAACERGDVFIVRGGWREEFIDELATFPNAAHDDQVDAASGAYNSLAGDAEWMTSDLKQLIGYEHDH